MITPIYSNRKIAKIRFFAAYAVSVLLFLILFSSFLSPDDDGWSSASASKKRYVDPHTAIYQSLHRQMQRLEQAAAEVTGNKSATNLSLLQKEEMAFFVAIDSVRTAVASMPNAERETELAALLESFSRAAEKRVSLARGVVQPTEKNKPSQSTEEASLKERIQELESQNRFLVLEKEVAVAAMQDAQNTQAPAPQRSTDAGAAQWKEKYETLKSTADRLKESNDRYASQAEELKKSYKEVVDDNRRLLTQLQEARAGKN